MDYPEITFSAWPKTSRLFKDPMVITEKIDGTNSAVGILGPFQFGQHVDGWPDEACIAFGADGEDGLPDQEYLVYAQSRKRLIQPNTAEHKGADNYGFAGWVRDNRKDLVRVLGPGLHFGEWWGEGIQRGYGLSEKRFSLFNTSRYGWLNIPEAREGAKVPGQLHVVPVLDVHTLDTEIVKQTLRRLAITGSEAAKGFMDPEGICVFLPSGQHVYKVTFDGDKPKWLTQADVDLMA